ncbi:MAG: ABC transporter permease, partial [Bryobacteraceae bacterium]
MPVFHELRYAARTLRKSPGFTAAAVGVLALGIGANTAIFSVVNAVLLRPLPFQDPDRLVMVWEHHVGGSSTNVANPVNFVAWQARNRVFEHMATFVEVPVDLAGEGEPEEVTGMAASADFFSILGVQPLLGRTFAIGEDRTGHNHVAILSHELWQRRFGGDPKIIGKPLALAGDSPTIIGVMPPDFRFPDTRAELWQPFVLDSPSVRHTGRFLTSFARLKPGVTQKEAQADMDVVASQLRRERPDFDAKWGVNVVSMREQAQGETRTPLLILFAAVGLLLLIACANAANLMLMRASSRDKELAIRASLGAGRLRLVRQLLLESITLSALAGALGVIIAIWATGALVTLLPKTISIHNVTAVSVDHTVLAFAVAISLLTGLLFGLAPALRAGHADLHGTLKEGGHGGTSGLSRQRLRSALVIAEVALSMVLL